MTALEVKQFLVDYIFTILGILGGLIILFLKGYFSEKGKNIALKSDNRFLTDENEKIKSKYTKELEELKKEHQLDITKRKFKYESKLQEYLKFFRLLDDFSRANLTTSQEKLLPILEEFNKNYLNAANQNNKKAETNATTVMSKKIQKLTFEANQDFLKIKQETQTIRVIASDQIVFKLGVLDLACQDAMNKAYKMMHNLPRHMMYNDQDKIHRDQEELELAGKSIDYIKNEIIQLMRSELNEI